MCKCIGALFIGGLPKPPVTVVVPFIFVKGHLLTFITHWVSSVLAGPKISTTTLQLMVFEPYGVAEWLTIRLEPVGGWRYEINTGLNSYKWPQKNE